MSEPRKLMCQCGSTDKWEIEAIAIDRVRFDIRLYENGEFDVVATGKEDCLETIYEKVVTCTGCGQQYSRP